MRLLVVGIKWPPETFIHRRLKGLAERGVEVVVATTSPCTKRRHGSGIQFLQLPEWNRSWSGRVSDVVSTGLRACMRSPRNVRAFASAVNGRGSSVRERLRSYHRFLPFVGVRADVVHFEWNSAAVEFLPFIDLLGCPVVVSCRGSQVQVAPHNPHRQALAEGLRTTFEKAAAAHCVSEAIKREAEAYGLDPGKAFVIRPAVDTEFFRPSVNRLRADHFRVISVGSLIWTKGYEYALMAVRRLVDRGVPVRFDIIGDGPKAERQRVLYTIQDLGLRSVVVLRGKLSPEEVLAALQSSDVFLLASLSEGISNAVLEAMACGLPVVTTDCGGMREAVSDGVEGFVVSVRNSEATASVLAKLASDFSLREKMGHAARMRVENQFSLTQQTHQFIQVYRDIIGAAAT